MFFVCNQFLLFCHYFGLGQFRFGQRIGFLYQRIFFSIRETSYSLLRNMFFDCIHLLPFCFYLGVGQFRFSCNKIMHDQKNVFLHCRKVCHTVLQIQKSTKLHRFVCEYWTPLPLLACPSVMQIYKSTKLHRFECKYWTPSPCQSSLSFSDLKIYKTSQICM